MHKLVKLDRAAKQGIFFSASFNHMHKLVKLEHWLIQIKINTIKSLPTLFSISTFMKAAMWDFGNNTPRTCSVSFILNTNHWIKKRNHIHYRCAAERAQTATGSDEENALREAKKKTCGQTGRLSCWSFWSLWRFSSCLWYDRAWDPRSFNRVATWWEKTEKIRKTVKSGKLTDLL